MDNFYLNDISDEVAPIIIGRRLTRVALDGSDLRLEFGGPRATLVARLSGDDPALYIASDESSKAGKGRTQVPSDENRSASGQQLLLQIRSKLIGGGATSIDKDDCDRVVRISLSPPDWSGAPGPDFTLTLILTGRSVNALLVGQGLAPRSAGFQPAPVPEP